MLRLRRSRASSTTEDPQIQNDEIKQYERGVERCYPENIRNINLERRKDRTFPISVGSWSEVGQQESSSAHHPP